MRDWMLLSRLAGFEDAALLILRLATGIFIIDGVLDNVFSQARMAEFSEFLNANGFPLPTVAAPFSVYTQLLAGVFVLFGVATRWGGLILVATFIIGLIMVHAQQSLREWWPALALVGIGAVLATRGAGRYSVDHLLAVRA